jgi:hypothetical protein
VNRLRLAKEQRARAQYRRVETFPEVADHVNPKSQSDQHRAGSGSSRGLADTRRCAPTDQSTAMTLPGGRSNRGAGEKTCERTLRDTGRSLSGTCLERGRSLFLTGGMPSARRTSLDESSVVQLPRFRSGLRPSAETKGTLTFGFENEPKPISLQEDSTRRVDFQGRDSESPAEQDTCQPPPTPCNREKVFALYHDQGCRPPGACFDGDRLLRRKREKLREPSP